MTDSTRSKDAQVWDAGDAGCGYFIVGLRKALSKVGPGELLEVRTRNIGARSDLPAWCRMTDHTLVSSDHPVYLLRKSTIDHVEKFLFKGETND